MKILKFISVVICFLLLSYACQKKKSDAVNFKFDPKVVPLLNTDSVTMLISDSGIIRYKMKAKTWKVYDRISDPYWYFPRGFYVEQFDSTLHIVATVKSDTAWNYTKRKMWQLRGHVYIHNKENEEFRSSELFWDEAKQKIFSKTFVEINRPGKTLLKAYNFEANQSMTEYTFSNVYKSRIIVNDSVNSQSQPQPKNETDSIKQPALQKK